MGRRGWWGAAEGYRGSGGETPSAGRFLHFLIKITHFYAHFGQNSYFKSNISSIKSV